MGDTNHIPATHLIGLIALTITSAIVADYMWYRISLRVPTTSLPINTVMDEISDIAANRWGIKGGT